MKDSQNSKKKPKKFLTKTVKPVVPPIEKKPFFPKFTKPRKLKLKDFERNLLLLLIPITLFFVFLSLHLFNERLTNEITKNQLDVFPSETEIHPYPFVRVTSGSMPLLDLSAKSAIITDRDSQVILFAKNPDLRFSMASTTKIMTALVALEYFKANSILTIQNTRVEGTTLGLTLGEQFYFEDLLYAMLLPSANDAATAIADNYPGGLPAFVLKMNEKAKALHLSNTHFADPSGLNDDGDYTTVTDMSRLASIAIQNKEFAKITSTKQRTITNVRQTRQFPLSNLNKLLGINGVTGIKTGTTEGAKEVLVTASVINGHTFVIVVMNSEDRFGDTRTLLNFISQQVQFINVTGAN